MNYSRVYHTLTMLADGTVLAVGGEPTWGQTGTSEVSGGILPAEIWNPSTQTWTPVAPMAATRGYHSTAILMPDGTVLVSGSGHANPGYAGQDSAQIYSPPYLFKGPRPTITSAPSAATYGSNISVSSPAAASISAVNLVSLGADTHQSDMDQHFVPLSFTQGSGALTVQIPSSAATAPPGNYMLFIVNSSGVPSVASMINIAATQTAPGAPSGVTAVGGNGSATVSWTAPADGGSPITSYTVTPYIGSSAQTPTTVTGSPPATGTTITGLTNGTTYTFVVTATNSVGTSPPSPASNVVTPSATTAPAFVQAASAHASGVSSLGAAPSSSITSGNRIVVEAGVWSSSGATAKTVTDSAGNQYVEVLHYEASDGTEMSVWTAPITAGGGTRPTITVTPTSNADMGMAVLEYSGLSSVASATVVDQMAHATGTTNATGSVASGATAATTAANELAIGFYADSGFGDSLNAGSGWTSRVNVSNTQDMEFLAEDQVVSAAGATPDASAGTGASTVWLMATVVLEGSSSDPPSGAESTGGASGAAMTSLMRRSSSPVAAGSGGLLSLAAAPLLVGHPAAVRPARTSKRAQHRTSSRVLIQRSKHSAASRKSKACASVRRAEQITAVDRARFIFDALMKGLPSSLFCFHGNSARLADGWTVWFRPSSA
jgi:Domain of unknown function (DUF1929)/Fibronectin type III domain